MAWGLACPIGSRVARSDNVNYLTPSYLLYRNVYKVVVNFKIKTYIVLTSIVIIISNICIFITTTRVYNERLKK